MSENSRRYQLIDTKVGTLEVFDTIEKAREALRSWIALQRQAGETVIQQPTGEWKDSRVTIWITGPDDQIVPLED